MQSRFYLLGGTIAANALLAISALTWTGCASSPDDAAYVPVKVSVPVDATGTRVVVAAEYHSNTDGVNDLPPPVSLADMMANANSSGGPHVFGSVYPQLVKDDPNLATEEHARSASIMEDLTTSSLFSAPKSLTGIKPDMDNHQAIDLLQNADIEIQVFVKEMSTEASPPVLGVTLQVVDVASGTVIRTETFQGQYQLAQALVPVKTQFSSDFSEMNLKEACHNALHMEPSHLDELLVVKELSTVIAKARNRALIAANSTVIPGLLQSSKTEDLVDLKVKLEQTLLDLEHNAELAKETAESAAAHGTDSPDAREMSLVYRERIAILKQIEGSVKDEIANRQR